MAEKTQEQRKAERQKKNQDRAKMRAERRASRMAKMAQQAEALKANPEDIVNHTEPKKQGCGVCSRAKKKAEAEQRAQNGDKRFDKKNNPLPTQRKIVIQNFTSPGDIMMITPVVKGLVENYGDIFAVDVRTTCMELWENNPYLTPISYMIDKEGKTVDDDGNEVTVIEARADELINTSRTNPYHYIHAYAVNIGKKLGINIPIEYLKGDIWMTEDEVSWMSQIQEIGINDNFWILNGGGKMDVTVKWWNPDFYQEVVDHFRGKITFVQVGQTHDMHPPLKGVINMIGKTSLRQFVRLMHHASGVLTPVSFAMHAAAAVPVPAGRCKSRACVVVAGGREPQQWEAYPNHRFLSMNGAMDCCDLNGCWKSRTFNLDDGADKKGTRCYYPLKVETKTKLPDVTIPTKIKGEKPGQKTISMEQFPIAKCMQLIEPRHVIDAIETYYKGGCLKYGSTIHENVPEKAKPYIVN